MKDTLSVEVFRDVSYPDIDTLEGVEGVELIKKFAPELALVRDDRVISIGGSNPTLTDVSKVKWPKFDADINIVLTGRDIASHKPGTRTLGQAAPMLRQKGIALVSRNMNADAQTTISTVAHESGHLLNLSYERNAETDRHCNDDECLMSPILTTEINEELIARRGIKLWMEKRGRLMPAWKETEVIRQRSFCVSCVTQLAQKAFWQLKLRQGERVLDSLL